MKKIALLSILLLTGMVLSYAKPINVRTAQSAGSNYYSHIFHVQSLQLSLAYTEKSPGGEPVYYVFNVNTDKGFIIVSAEDATHPILGYSNEGGYAAPTAGSNAAYWMNKEKDQIIAIRANNIQAGATLKNEWASCINNTFDNSNTHRVSSFVGPFCATTWDQSPYYNAYCPGSPQAVTGCVATTMGQIMKYWNYPPHGIGYASYDDVNPPYSENYGWLFAYLDTSNYMWASMPNKVISPGNSQVAKLLYDAGVTLQMNYSPSNSGSFVSMYDFPGANSQESFPNYFGYTKYIHDELRRQHTTAAWLSLIEAELNAVPARIVSYSGLDPVNGGHNWVCDGYNTADNYLHMNWGWSGADDGYFNVDSLNPSGTPYHFNDSEEVLTNIKPPPAKALFMGNPTAGCAGMKVQFTDQSFGPAPSFPVTAWKWTFAGGTPPISTSQNPVVTYTGTGAFNVTLVVTTAKGTDTMVKSSYITVLNSASAPLAQGFEQNFPPLHWSENNPSNYFVTWSKASVGGYGLSAHSMAYNNSKTTNANIGDRQQMYSQPVSFFSTNNPELYFDVAYAPYNNQFSDTLAVYYSTDCGVQWTQVYLKGGMSLCTTGKSVQNGANTDSGTFKPLNTNWRTDTIYLGSLAGNPDVMFSFENRCGKGSSMYIDNVNIKDNPLSVFNITEDNTLAVYPNPNNGSFTLQFDSHADKTYAISVYDMLGQEVMHNQVAGSGGRLLLPVNLTGCSKGIYTVVLKSDNQQTVKKIAVF